MKVTKREILVSIIIGCLLMILGLFISYKIEDVRISEKEKYNKALKINENKEMFSYAINTSVGNIIVYDKFKVNNGVKSEWLKNDYMYIKKITEIYAIHHRRVCSGKTIHCHIETHHSWDYENSETNNVKSIVFGGISFDFSEFTNYPIHRLNLDNSTVIDSINSKIKDNYIYQKDKFFHIVGDKRYYYKVVNKSFKATVFGNTKNKNFKDGDKLTINTMNIKEFLESKNNSFTIIQVIFWIVYIMISGFIIYEYVYLDNDYLEN